jgi:hypothetical protein
MATDPMNPTPPVEPFDMLPPEPAQWPKVVGTISIVWSSIGLLCGVCGIGFLAFMPQMMKSAEQQLGPMPDIMKPNPIQLATSALGFIPAVLLLISGIVTVLRRPVGRPLHLVYAILGLLIGVVGIGYGIKHQLDVMAWAQANQDNKWAQNAKSPFAFIGIAFGAVLSFAWPIFCLIWFGLVKRDTRDLAAGPEPAA